MRRAPGGLDLADARYRGEACFTTRPSLRATAVASRGLVRRRHEHVIDRTSDPPSPPSHLRALVSTRAFASLDDGLDRFQRLRRDAPAPSAIRKAFHLRAPRPSFSCESPLQPEHVFVNERCSEWCLAAPGRRGLCRYVRVHVMRIARVSTHRRFFTSRLRSKLSLRPKGETLAPSFTRIRRTTFFQDAVPMARFSNLMVAGPTATPRLLQHNRRTGTISSCRSSRFATGAKTPTAPLRLPATFR